MGLTSKAFSDIITFSRASNATRTGPDGKIAYAPHNLFTYSEQFDNAAWTKSEMSVTANSIASPSGTVNADKVISSTVNTYHQVSSNVTTVANVVYALSVYLKMAEGRYANLLVNNNGGFSAIGIDMQTGTIVTNSVAVAQASGSIQSVGNGWYRAVIFIQAASTSLDFRITASNSANTSWTFAGDGTSGFYVWGAQASAGNIAGDYTPTTSAAVYGPRFDYDPVTLAAKGLLIEEQRTNLITYSEAFDNAAWTLYQATVTANATTAPDGTSTADMLSATGSPFGLALRSISVTSGATYTATVFLKGGSISTGIFGVTDTGTGLDYSVSVNLNSGTITSTSAGITSSIQAAGNGWYRVAITRTASGTSLNPFVGPNASSGSIYAWGAQMEAGAFATSHIPTVASTVTRSADVASVNTLSPWYNATQGTLYVEVNRYAQNVNVRGAIFHDGTTSNYLALSEVTYSGSSAAVVSGGAVQAAIGTGSTSIGIKKNAFAYKTNDFALSENGGSVLTDTSGTIPTVTTMGVGNLTSANVGTGHIRRIAYYPRRLTNAELQALTA
jgi:hypothetical protein